ncbi:ABC transporter substrate-binding protein [Paenarthrobacter nicotinovorans]|uniref:ABC transporter substrate-binding protein n=1 Tax=Paenarthrobacter nicotinovorans TaxID=29320 RepID=UPI0037487ABF
MMFRSKKLAALLAIAALGLAACTPGEQGNSAESTSGGTLTLAQVGPPGTFAAAQAGWVNSSQYMQAVYDTILTAAPDGSIQPGLATEWSYNDDKTVITLKIRDGVKFTDGTPLDASAVAQNLVRFRDGAGGLAANLADMADATATDASTVTIKMKRSNPALLTYLTRAAGLVEAPSAFNKPDVQTVPVGSGPYTLNTSETVEGTSYVFDRNPNYWKPENVHYDKLVLNVYQDQTALLNAIKGGQVNGGNSVGNQNIEQMKAAGFVAYPAESTWVGLSLLDREGAIVPALKDVRVRQAINYAFDTKALLNAVENGAGTTTSQIFMPTDAAAYVADLDSHYSYDPEKARKLLAEAGYASGLTIPMNTVTVLGTTVYTLIKQQLADVGITVQYTDSGNNFLADIASAKYPMTYIPLGGPTAWEALQLTTTPDASFNPFHTRNSELDGYLETIRSGSETEAADAAKKANKYLVDNAWYAPWYRATSNYVADSKTEIKLQADNALPYLWNIKPKA